METNGHIWFAERVYSKEEVQAICERWEEHEKKAACENELVSKDLDGKKNIKGTVKKIEIGYAVVFDNETKQDYIAFSAELKMKRGKALKEGDSIFFDIIRFSSSQIAINIRKN